MKIKHLFLVLSLLFPLMGCDGFINSHFFEEEDFAEPEWPGGYEGLLIVRSTDNSFEEEKFQNVDCGIVTTGAHGRIWHSDLTFDSFPMDAGGNKTTTKLVIESISGKAVTGRLYLDEDFPPRAIWNGKEYRVNKITGNYQMWVDEGFERLLITIILEDPKIVIDYDGRRPYTDPDKQDD